MAETDWIDNGGPAGEPPIEYNTGGMSFRDAAAIAVLPYFLNEAGQMTTDGLRRQGYEEYEQMAANQAYRAAQALVSEKRRVEAMGREQSGERPVYPTALDAERAQFHAEFEEWKRSLEIPNRGRDED